VSLGLAARQRQRNERPMNALLPTAVTTVVSSLK
jgi:hypothetical protein